MFNVFKAKKKETIQINETVERLNILLVYHEHDQSYCKFSFILKNYDKIFSLDVKLNSFLAEKISLTNVGDNISFEMEDNNIIHSSFENHSIKLLLNNSLIMKKELSLD